MSSIAPPASPLADFFAFLAELTSFPGRRLEESLASGEVAGVLRHLSQHLGAPGLALGPFGDHQDGGRTLDQEYIRLFDVPDGPATPMYTGVYASRRRDAMEELLRFYRLFGLTVSDASHDLPDFVPTVLEFLSFLALEDGGDPTGRQRAMLDVLERHLCPWAAQTRTRLDSRAAHPFYAGLVALIDHAGSTLVTNLRAGRLTV